MEDQIEAHIAAQLYARLGVEVPADAGHPTFESDEDEQVRSQRRNSKRSP